MRKIDAERAIADDFKKARRDGTLLSTLPAWRIYIFIRGDAYERAGDDRRKLKLCSDVREPLSEVPVSFRCLR